MALVARGSIVRDVGVLANAIVFGGDLLLADVGLSETAQEGMVLVTRLLEFEAFAMTTGVARDFDPEVAAVVAKSFRETVIRGEPAGAVDAKTRSRLGRLLFQFSSLEPDDAQMRLAAVAAAEPPEGDPRRAAFRRASSREGKRRRRDQSTAAFILSTTEATSSSARNRDMAPSERTRARNCGMSCGYSAEEKRFELLVDLHPRRFSKPLP